MCAATGPSDPSATAGAQAALGFDPPAFSGEPEDLIRSRRNPLVARLRDLHGPRGRRRQGELLLEGTHLLEEALNLGLAPLLVLATPAWLERHRPLVARLPPAAVVRQASAEVVAAAATTEHPDGVLATLAPPPPAGESGRPQFVLALDALQDPGNLGTLLRTARGAGVEQVWLGEGADPWQPKVLRASSGAALALPPRRLGPGEIAEALAEARRNGLQVLAAVLPSPLWSQPVPYWQCDWLRPTLLLLGNEGRGLDASLAPLVDGAITIPHDPALESLNVAVAAAPLLLERWRQRAGGGWRADAAVAGGGEGDGDAGGGGPADG
jgi:TrmH family RNA methyltransferase